jgi:hypothetical protein
MTMPQGREAGFSDLLFDFLGDLKATGFVLRPAA